MEKLDSFERMASGISDEERQNILDQMHSSENSNEEPIHLAEEGFDNIVEPFEIRIKKESLFLRFFIWLKAIFTNTTQKAIYNEYKLSQIGHHIEKNFPGIISVKNGNLQSAFYDRLNELKSCADFFKPYFLSLEDNEGSFYVFLSTLIMPAVTTEINTKADPYSTPVTPDIPSDQRSSLLRKLEEIFDTIPADEKARMYQSAKAFEWLKQFLHLSFTRFLTLFTSTTEDGYTCKFTQAESEIDSFSRILCSSIDIPDEFLEALYLFAVRNSKHATSEETGRDAGEFLTKAHSSFGLLQLFLSSVPVRSLGCIIHQDSQWRTDLFSGGEDWFVKYKNTWKKIFEQKWISWEADCKKEALLLTLKTDFGIDTFPKFPERPWAELWGGISFAYDSTLGFLNYFMTEKFPECELDLKTLLVQGSFNKQENHTQLSESFNALVQLSISLQSFARKLSVHGETGAIFYKIHEDKSRTLQAQSKVEKMMRSIESDFMTILNRFGDSCRSVLKVLDGVLGLSKDTRFDTVKNLSSIKGKDKKTFSQRVELSRNTINNALNFVMKLEGLDRQKQGK